MAQKTTVVILADDHAGSPAGLFPGENWELEDGKHLGPNDWQTTLWTHFLDCGAQVADYRRGGRLVVVADVDETLAVMRRAHVGSLVGVPVQVLALAIYGEGLSLKSALLTTDHVPQAITRTVEAAWGCKVYNHYGMTEMGLGGGVECSARRGCHLRGADLLFEIVDPATGAPLADGTSGELVFTALTRRGMPLIRYRTGDVGRFLLGPCPCGAALKTLARVTQRVDGAIQCGDDRITMAELDEALFALPGVLNFSATVDRFERDCLTLEIRATEKGASLSAGEIATALESVPAVQHGRARGDLACRVSMAHTGYQLAGPPKRTIADQRAPSDRA